MEDVDCITFADVRKLGAELERLVGGISEVSLADRLVEAFGPLVSQSVLLKTARDLIELKLLDVSRDLSRADAQSLLRKAPAIVAVVTVGRAQAVPRLLRTVREGLPLLRNLSDEGHIAIEKCLRAEGQRVSISKVSLADQETLEEAIGGVLDGICSRDLSRKMAERLSVLQGRRLSVEEMAEVLSAAMLEASKDIPPARVMKMYERAPQIAGVACTGDRRAVMALVDCFDPDAVKHLRKAAIEGLDALDAEAAALQVYVPDAGEAAPVISAPTAAEHVRALEPAASLGGFGL